MQSLVDTLKATSLWNLANAWQAFGGELVEVLIGESVHLNLQLKPTVVQLLLQRFADHSFEYDVLKTNSSSRQNAHRF